MWSTIALNPIGRVESRLTDPAAAPRQADEGAPEAWLVIDTDFAAGLQGLKAGDDAVLITWLDRAQRDVLVNHPRNDPSRPVAGVFTTRSPHRPNPLGLHQVTIAAVEGSRVLVKGLEAVDGTPIVDIKGLLNPDIAQR
jgi:tRNA-Thr(GGU) m(6)t(6)A37 methyltransferase TsaA